MWRLKYVEERGQETVVVDTSRQAVQGAGVNPHPNTRGKGTSSDPCTSPQAGFP